MGSFAGRTYWWKGTLITTAACLLVSRKERGRKHKLMQKGTGKHRELIDHILHTVTDHFMVKVANFSNKLIKLQNIVTSEKN